MASTSVFVENAANEVANEAVFAGDEKANELLASARRHIYHWPRFFEGFTADLTFTMDGQVYQGHFRASESRRIEVKWEQEFDNRWMRFQLEELLSHREAPERSKIASKTGCEMGDYDPIYGQKIIFVGDKMGSFYRIRDEKIMQIGRSYGNTTFIINIDSHHNFGTPGRPAYAAADYTAFYWAKDSGRLTKTETYRDAYEMIGGIALPAERRVSIAQDLSQESLSIRQLKFRNFELLTSPSI